MTSGELPAEAPTRRLPDEERTTSTAPGRSTGPAYVAPGSHPGYPMAQPFAASASGRVDLGKWLSEGWQVYRKEPWTFSLSFFLLIFLSLVTLTIVTGPMLAGFYHMVFKSMRGERPEVGDLFKGFDRFWPAVFAWVIQAALLGTLGGPSQEYPLFGLISLALMPLVNAVFFFVYPLIKERQRDTAQALEEAGRVVFPNNILSFWVCGLIFQFIALFGLLGCGIGFLVTSPFILCAMAVAYRDFFGLPGTWNTPPAQPWWGDQAR